MSNGNNLWIMVCITGNQEELVNVADARKIKFLVDATNQSSGARLTFGSHDVVEVDRLAAERIRAWLKNQGAQIS